MVEHSKDPPRDGTENELARRFAQLRATEADTAPPFPDQAVPITARQSRAGTWRSRQALSRIAAAVAVVAITIALLSNRPEPDPAAVYASIMNQQQMQTDPLLVVSDSVLPAMLELPSLYEIDVEFDAETYPN